MSITSNSINKILLLAILFYFLVPCHFIYAQSSSEKIDSLNELAAERASQRPLEGVQFARAAIKLNRNSLYRKGRYHSFLNLGISYSNLGQYDSAVFYLREAEPFFRGGFVEALIQYYMGVNYCNIRGYKTAKDFFHESWNLFQSTGNYAQTADPLRALGFIALQKKDYDSALIYLFRASELKLQYGLDAFGEFGLVSLVFEKMGSFTEAIRYERKALKGKQNSTVARPELVESYSRLASLFTARSDLDSARWSYQEGLKLTDSKLDLPAVKCVLGLAELLERQDRSGAAIERISSTLESTRDIEEEGKFLLELKLAEMYLSNGSSDSAIYFGKMALRSARAASLDGRSTEALDLLIRSSRLGGSKEVTLAFYEEQVRLLNQLYESAITDRGEEWSKQVRLLDMVNDQAIAIQQEEISILRRERLVLALLLFLGIGVMLLLLALYRYRSQLERGKEEKNGIKKSMQNAQEDLYKQTLHMMHMNNCLEEVEEQVKLLMASNPDQKLSKILKSIRMNKSMDRDWEDFNSYFGNVNTGFYEKLSDYSDKLSNHDRRVCALIKLNLTNREIATILNIEVKSVSMIKYRIKKKLGLDDEVELSHFITQL